MGRPFFMPISERGQPVCFFLRAVSLPYFLHVLAGFRLPKSLGFVKIIRKLSLQIFFFEINTLTIKNSPG